MKLLFFIMMLIIITAVNCTKDNSVSIVGNWSLINDSVYSSVGAFSFGNNYVGLDGDYFNFADNDMLYTKEGNKYDTSRYIIMGNNQVIIDSISLYENNEYIPSSITNLTTHNASIEVVPDHTNPGGGYARFINLKRN